MDRRVEEALLGAWMDMALHIRGNRIVTGLSFNEIVVCSMLYRSMQEGVGMLTATDLGSRTKLLKSQLNKVLTLMEEKGLIERIRSEKDKRKIYLKLQEESLSVYLEEHEKVMVIVHQVCVSLGEEKARMLSELLLEAVAVVDRYNL
ncbi:MAG: MarR family transcriptional regulator [Lachnospiraceae bacterium]|nr:MarR family transcriptional regulator [Lachnospiraceae bacterium]